MHVRTCHCLDSEGVTNRKELEPFQVYFLSLYSSVALYCSAFNYLCVHINMHVCVCAHVCAVYVGLMSSCMGVSDCVSLSLSLTLSVHF